MNNIFHHNHNSGIEHNYYFSLCGRSDFKENSDRSHTGNRHIIKNGLIKKCVIITSKFHWFVDRSCITQPRGPVCARSPQAGLGANGPPRQYSFVILPGVGGTISPMLPCANNKRRDEGGGD